MEEVGNQLLKNRKNIKRNNFPKGKMGIKVLKIVLLVIIVGAFTFVAYNIWFKKTDTQNGETQTVKVVKDDVAL